MRNSSPSAPDRSPHPYDSGRSNRLGWRAELNDLKKHYLLEEHQKCRPEDAWRQRASAPGQRLKRRGIHGEEMICPRRQPYHSRPRRRAEISASRRDMRAPSRKPYFSRNESSMGKMLQKGRRFSKTVLDSFFSFLPLRHEYREFDAEGRTSTHADWVRSSVDPRPESGNAAGRAQQGRMQAHLHRRTQRCAGRTSGG
jgi:hypothetical protein